MGPIGCPEMSVTNYQATQCNIPEQRKPQLQHAGSLKSHVSAIFFFTVAATTL
jgi:hypothetical protein